MLKLSHLHERWKCCHNEKTHTFMRCYAHPRVHVYPKCNKFTYTLIYNEEQTHTNTFHYRVYLHFNLIDIQHSGCMKVDLSMKFCLLAVLRPEFRHRNEEL